MNKKQKEFKRVEEAVRLAEKGGNFDTVHHERLAKLTKKMKPVVVKEKDDGESNR